MHLENFSSNLSNINFSGARSGRSLIRKDLNEGSESNRQQRTNLPDKGALSQIHKMFALGHFDRSQILYFGIVAIWSAFDLRK